MELREATAIIRGEALEKIARQLQEMGVEGVSVTRVKGYGEYANFSTNDWLVSHARIEIFTEKTRAEQLAHAILGWRFRTAMEPMECRRAPEGAWRSSLGRW